ncbi:uncharacterized protein EI90DRAFT_3076081 [Cantharellus anzutake]|uniref:uncharacterized protein n=1 Tax=Cantharellus anzutake TaxID=1750568 RepID=UPI001905A0F4|nr:uncharacterized protein EI90DRAFT_3293256 [Cantharellus anzutake]XP_038911317.1 uncharacterized protein EI90DRAFT_3076081 [Cantharellus anzutake]KAF8318563.1 hypothetical protein EI90DRAFT_3293256 [Cantharellus anzutake]KAF8324152.1 hypothetical protein EI90DRAFT_3076081 [Cantharellus anzutake]
MPSFQSQNVKGFTGSLVTTLIIRQACLFELFLGLGVDKVSAQEANVTCPHDFQWAFNSQGKSPCKVGSELIAVGAGGKWLVGPLPPGGEYIGPSLSSSGYFPNACLCSSVVYQLMAACGACQNRSYTSYPLWGHYCAGIANAEGEYQPSLIPTGTLIPRWAYMKPSDFAGLFNLDAAKTISDRPESSRVFLLSSTASSTSTASNGAHGSRGSNIGVTVGGVIGGVIALGLVAVVAMWIFKRMSSDGSPAVHSQGRSVLPVVMETNHGHAPLSPGSPVSRYSAQGHDD